MGEVIRKTFSCFAYVFGFPIKFQAFGAYTRGVQTKIYPHRIRKKISNAFGAKFGPNLVRTSAMFRTSCVGRGAGQGLSQAAPHEACTTTNMVWPPFCFRIPSPCIGGPPCNGTEPLSGLSANRFGRWGQCTLRWGRGGGAKCTEGLKLASPQRPDLGSRGCGWVPREALGVWLGLRGAASSVLGEWVVASLYTGNCIARQGHVQSRMRCAACYAQHRVWAPVSKSTHHREEFVSVPYPYPRAVSRGIRGMGILGHV